MWIRGYHWQTVPQHLVIEITETTLHTQTLYCEFQQQNIKSCDVSVRHILDASISFPSV